MVALFLSTDIRQLGIKMNEKEVVQQAIAELVSDGTPSKLSVEGMREFNKYVYGGFDVLLEGFDDLPQSLETFLLQYNRELDKNLSM